MQISVHYQEITDLIYSEFGIKVQIHILTPQVVNICYSTKKFISIDFNLKVDAIQKHCIYLSYDCNKALSLMLQGVLALNTARIPKGVEINSSTKRIIINMTRFDEIKKVLQYVDITDITFTEMGVNVILKKV